MIKEKEMVIPKELAANMQILTTLVSPIMLGIGILVMGENMDAKNHKDGHSILRVYLLHKKGSKYHIENELQAFAFPSIESAYKFLMRLPEMSALELLFAVNSMEIDFTEIGSGSNLLQ